MRRHPRICTRHSARAWATHLLTVVLLSLLGGALVPAGRAWAQPLPDPGHMTGYRGQNDLVVEFIVTGTVSGCTVWGTDIYTDDSCLRRAAVHAGILADGQTGVVAVRVLPGRSSYASSTRNGVTTSPWGSWPGSYEFVSGAALLDLSLSETAVTLIRTEPMSPVTATVQGGTPPFAFSIDPPLPDGLTLDPDTGTISGTPTEAHPTTTHTVTVTDLGGNGEVALFDQPVGRLEAMPTATATIDITVNHPPVALTLSPTLVATTRGQPLPVVTATATGGSEQGYQFSVDPPLPDGVSIDPDTGTISGTPTVAQPTTVHTVTVQDIGDMVPDDHLGPAMTARAAAVGPDRNGMATATVEITVSHPPLGLTLTPSAVTAFLGRPMTTVSATATGGSEQGYQYSVDPPLPAGVSIDPATGTISGTPTVEQPATLHTVTIVDTGGTVGVALSRGDPAIAAAAAPVDFATATLELTVLFEPLGLILTPSTVVATRGRAMPQVIATVSGGGDGPPVFTVAPPLPAGVVLDPATGRISGVPLAVQPAREHIVTVRRSGSGVVAEGRAAAPPDETASATLNLTVVEDDERVAEAFGEATGAFMARRNERILSAEPRAWRLDRRRAAAGSSGTDLVMRATDEGLALRFATARVSADARWYAWAEGEYADFRDGAAGAGRSFGRFGMISAGADMLLNDRMSLGFMVQADSASDTVPDLSRVSGDGWLAGPYLSAELRPGLFLSTRAAWGRSRNNAEVDVYQDGSARFAGAFTTARTLVRATLHGQHEMAGGTRILPEIDYAWIRDRQNGYIVTDGISTVAVAGLTSELHRLSAGVTIETPLSGSNGRAMWFVRPMLTMNESRTGAIRTRAGQGSVELGLRTGAEAGWSGEAALRLDSSAGGFRAVALRASAAVNF